MAARKVTADVHGITVRDMGLHGGGAYNKYITPTLNKLSELSGKSRSDVHDALAKASINFKSRTERQMSPTDALRDIATDALSKLGVHDKNAHNALYDDMTNTADK